MYAGADEADYAIHCDIAYSRQETGPQPIAASFHPNL